MFLSYIFISCLIFLSMAFSIVSSRKIFFFVFILVVCAQLILTFRVTGIDLNNYISLFKEPNLLPYDLGFRVLIEIITVITDDHRFVLVCIWITNLIVLFLASRNLQISFPLLILIYSLHLFLIRDLAQIRIGLAMNIVILSISFIHIQKKFLSWITLGIAISIHLSIFIFVPIFIVGRQIGAILLNNKNFIFFIAMSAVMGLLLGDYFEIIFQFFPQRAGRYANEGSIAISSLVLVVLYFVLLINFNLNNELSSVLRLSLILAIFFLIVGGEFSIITLRIVSLFTGLYIIPMALRLESITTSKKIHLRDLPIFLILIAIFLRPGNKEILEAIKF